MADEWKEVGAGGEVWEYKGLKVGTSLVGTYLFKEEEVGENKSNLYSLENSEGDTIQVWGSTVLDSRFKNIKPGELVKIVYLGEKPSPNRKDRNYHDFQVFKREVPFKEVTDETSVNPDDIPDNLGQ